MYFPGAGDNAEGRDTRNIAQEYSYRVIECLPSTHKALGSIPSSTMRGKIHRI